MTRFNERVRRLLLGATCLLTASLAAPGAHAADN